MKSLAIGICFALAMAGAAWAAQPVGSGDYVPRTARGQAAGEIVRKWSGYVLKVYGTEPAAWATAMRGTFAEASLTNLQRAAKMHTYEAMMATMLGQQTSDAKMIDLLAKSDGSSASVMSLGSAAEDLVYTMVAPCRIMDTRVAGGRLAAGTTRSIAVHGANFTAQGGAATTCGIPSDPSAVAINVVAVTPDGSGFLTIFPAGTTRPSAASLNYTAGSVVANEVLAKTTLGQPTDVAIYTHAGTDIVVDIVGYFMAPKVTMLDCVYAQGNLVTPPNGGQATSVAGCAAGYRVAGTSCEGGAATLVYVDTLLVFDGFACTKADRVAGNGANEGFEAWATCCRVPGR